MQAKVVSISELTDRGTNPTLCLSPLRVFGLCHKCVTFKRHQRMRKTSKCKPQITDEIKARLERKQILLDELNKINKKLTE